MFILIMLCSGLSLQAQTETAKGSISGTIVDAESHAPLSGVRITIEGSTRGALSRPDGAFIIHDVPAGSYSLHCTSLAYEARLITDVIVRPQRDTRLEIALNAQPIQTDEVLVSAGVFRRSDREAISHSTFSREEIRRAPGSAGDVSRILMSLPALAKVNDQSNSLIVRGGSAMENAFYVDNIAIPNINHFPTQGTGGGPIGILNVDLIENVAFYAGAFPAQWGEKLSAVMDIKLRTGNPDKFESQMDLNIAGFGIVTEGPLPGEKNSWLLSARRSYLDILVNALDLGTDNAPRYGDAQLKLHFTPDQNHSLNVLAVWSDDQNVSNRANALENAMLIFGSQDLYQWTAGVNWRALWSAEAWSATSLSFTTSAFHEDLYETAHNSDYLRNRSTETYARLRNTNYLRLASAHTLEFGIETTLALWDYNMRFAANTNAVGDSLPALHIAEDLSTPDYALFANWRIQAGEHLSLNLGVRAHYAELNKNASIAPRASLAWQFNEATTFNLSAGLFAQRLPAVLLLQHPAARTLDQPEALHLVAGVNHIFGGDIKVSLEAYHKEYRHFPMDPTRPDLFIVDEVYYSNGIYAQHTDLSAEGEAFARGLEFTLHKKLTGKLYGLLAAAWSTAQYRTAGGSYKNRLVDNRYTLSIEGGYKASDTWEFSARWILAGGVPYTPLDLAASRASGQTVLDESRINTARYPAYHSLNLRADRRFHFAASNLVVYLSVWNAYNRKNPAAYYWNAEKGGQSTIYQWGILPIFGIEYEF